MVAYGLVGTIIIILPFYYMCFRLIEDDQKAVRFLVGLVMSMSIYACIVLPVGTFRIGHRGANACVFGAAGVVASITVIGMWYWVGNVALDAWIIAILFVLGGGGAVALSFRSDLPGLDRT